MSVLRSLLRLSLLLVIEGMVDHGEDGLDGSAPGDPGGAATVTSRDSVSAVIATHRRRRRSARWLAFSASAPGRIRRNSSSPRRLQVPSGPRIVGQKGQHLRPELVGGVAQAASQAVLEPGDLDHDDSEAIGAVPVQMRELGGQALGAVLAIPNLLDRRTRREFGETKFGHAPDDCNPKAKGEARWWCRRGLRPVSPWNVKIAYSNLQAAAGTGGDGQRQPAQGHHRVILAISQYSVEEY